MKYKEQLSDLILNGEDDDMMNWILQQPLLDQPDIFRELNQLALELEAQSGIKAEGIADFDTQIDGYEQAVLDEKLAQANYNMALEERDKVFGQADELIAGSRNYTIECIVNDAPNAQEMKELATKIIELEKTNGLYDPENWKQIL